MSEKKSILAETLENIEAAKQQVEENASFILSSTLKEELNEVIKQGLSEGTEDMAGDEEEPVDQTPTNDAPIDTPPADAPPTEEPTSGLNDAGPGGEEVIDLTGATPDEVIGSFKLMSPTDEIEIVKTENGIEFKVGQEATEPSPEADVAQVEPEALAEDAEPVFEIEITEDEEDVEGAVEEAMSHHVGMKKRNIAHNGNDPLRVEEGETVAEGDGGDSESETHEEDEDGTAVRGIGESQEKLVAARKKSTQLALENKKLQKQLAQINETVTTFKQSEKEYQQANEKLKTQLQEVALFTSNLTYAVKLMTENSTTKEEKIQILRNLDNAKTIEESRTAYKTLSESFKSSRSSKAEQIIETKILGNEKGSGASKINETVVYEDPTVARIKEIIAKMK